MAARDVSLDDLLSKHPKSIRNAICAPFVRMGLRLSCVSQEKAAAAEAAATAAQRAFLEAEASLTPDTSTVVNPNAQTALSAEEFVNKH